MPMFKVKFVVDDPSMAPKMTEIGNFRVGKTYPVIHIDNQQRAEPLFFVADEDKIIQTVEYREIRLFARYVENRGGRPPASDPPVSPTDAEDESLIGG